MKQEVEKWRPFGHPDGDIRDLSFLDAHQALSTFSIMRAKSL